MDEITKNILGYSGGSLLVITLFPQIYQTYKTKQTRDLSLLFVILQIITCILFLSYGILLKEYPLVIANSIVFLEQLLLLYAKLMFNGNGNGNGNILEITEI